MVVFFISILLAYLLGSVSSAIVIAKMLHLPDPRTEGSGNPGATNMLRLGGKQIGIIVLVCDVFKGIIAVLIGKILGLPELALGFVALAAVMGHIFPLYYKFKGGKGVATAIGTILLLSFWVGIFVIATWIIFGFAFRYASLASLAAMVAAPIYLLITGHHAVFPVFLIAVLIIWKHWENIERLREGTEHKLEF